MKERIFRFKRFSVSHTLSAHKVGVDGVLVGSWADVCTDKKILDVGCGCGLIALMCAQRAPEARITGIDCDEASIAEAARNIANSPFAEVVAAKETGWKDFIEEAVEKNILFDHIVSNPPYFISGVSIDETAQSRRMAARHAAELSPASLLSLGKKILAPKTGKISFIAPFCNLNEIKDIATENELILTRLSLVRDRLDKPVKRMLCEWRLAESGQPEAETQDLILHSSENEPTEEYRTLCRDFYLKF